MSWGVTRLRDEETRKKRENRRSQIPNDLRPQLYVCDRQSPNQNQNRSRTTPTRRQTHKAIAMHDEVQQ